MRRLLEVSIGNCSSDQGEPCVSTGGGDVGQLVCAQPVFPANSTKFVQIRREERKDFLFVGNPALIYTSIRTSKYCPRLNILPPLLPGMIERLLNYVVSFSLGLAVLNVVPSIMLDGHHMIGVILGKKFIVPILALHPFFKMHSFSKTDFFRLSLS